MLDTLLVGKVSHDLVMKDVQTDCPSKKRENSILLELIVENRGITQACGSSSKSLHGVLDSNIQA